MEQSQTKYIPELTALRGVCALLVILFHLNLWDSGWVGVQCFFVLSGYLVSLSYESIKYNKKEFLVRRSMRILPVLLLYVLAMFVLDAVLKEHIWTVGYIGLLTSTYNFTWLLDGWISHVSINHLWSVFVEIHFYLIWLFIWPLVQSKKSRLYLCCLFVVIVPFFRWFFFDQIASGSEFMKANTTYVFSISHLDAFAMGAMLTTFSLKSLRRILPFSSALLLIIWMAININFYGSNFQSWISDLGVKFSAVGHYEFVWGYSLLNAVFFVFIAWCITKSGTWKIFNFCFHQLGKVSYSTYVWHGALVFLIVYFGFYEVLWIKLATMVAAHGLGWLSYELIERRASFLIKKVKVMP